MKSVSRRSLQSGQSALRTVASTPSLIDLYLTISSPKPNAFGKEDLLFDRFHQEDTSFWFQPGNHVSLPIVDHRGLVEETNASDEVSQYLLEGHFHLHEGCLKPPKRPHSFSTVFKYSSLYIHIIYTIYPAFLAFPLAAYHSFEDIARKELERLRTMGPEARGGGAVCGPLKVETLRSSIKPLQIRGV